MARTRSTPAKRRTTRKTTRKKAGSPIWAFDALGVALIFLCPITLIALCASESSGLLGQYITPALRGAVGVGAYIIPFFFALLGAIFIVGPLKLIPRNIGIGSLILFLVIITWASLTATIEKQSALRAGGLVGKILSRAIRAIAGDSASGHLAGYLLLTAAALIAVVIIVDVPIALLIDKARGAWRAWRDTAYERAEAARDLRAEDKPDKPDKPKPEEPVSESRRRMLATMFGKAKAGEEEPADDAAPVLQMTKPPVKINGPTTIKTEKPPKNGGSGEAPLEPAQSGEFILPPTSLLDEPPPPPQRVESELRDNIEVIERTLEDFKVTANVVEIACGPTVARYEIELAPGIKVNKIVGLADNLAMQLAAIDVRVEAPIPGKAAIGVEVPNKNRGMVVLREIVESKAFTNATSKLTFALGKNVSGKAMVADLAKMPHMLVGGATNAGKSVGLNTLIASLLFRATPDELKLVLIDPKRVELSLFDGIPHLACPVVKDVKQAAGTFRAVVQEMERRYELFSRLGSRNIDGYNGRVSVEERMPYMVVVVDELCDLMMQAAAEVEGSITRIAQLARATGIHLVVATQRPSVDVITGIIKANISSRIAFAVSSHHDSRTILDQKGAERLIGRGDMLFLPIDASKPARIQGCYTSEREIEALCKFLKDQRKPVYTIQPGQAPGGGGIGGAEDESMSDEFYEPSVRFIVNTGYCSTSMLQRKFKIGYTRAARIVDTMEQQGIVGPLDGAKPRQVLITKAELESILGGPVGMRDDDYDEEAPPADLIGPDDDEDGEE